MNLETNIKDMLVIIGGFSVIGKTLQICTNYAIKYSPSGGSIDTKSNFEKVMNTFGYNQRNMISDEKEMYSHGNPWPNHNPDTRFGRFASQKGYFKLEGAKI